MSSPTTQLSVDPTVEYNDGTSWVDISDDVIQDADLAIDIGIRGTGPLDNVAGTGTCAFDLKNANPLGQYSPGHANVKTGWTIGADVRVSFDPNIALASSDGDAIQSSDGDALEVAKTIRFIGRVTNIDPEAGQHLTRRCHVMCEDYMGLLADAVIREISAQVDATDMALLTSIYNALESDSKPPYLLLDDAIDTYPTALDDVSAGQPAMGLMKDVLDSCFGILAQRGDGVLFVKNRNARTYDDSLGTFDDDDIRTLRNPTAKRQLFNRVEVEMPQIVIGASNEVLTSAVGQDNEGVDDGETIEQWLNYRDPNDTSSNPVAIGGTSFVAIVSGTDYVFNSAADGTGSNVTASMTVTASPFAGSVKFSITNNSGAPAYRITLQQRGLAIRRYKPITIVSESAQSYGVRRLGISLRYQDARSVTEFIADFIRSQYEEVSDRPEMVELQVMRSETNLRHALERESVDRITLSETATGLSADAFIQSISLRYRRKILTCEWTLAPQSSFLFIEPWLLGTAGKSELGETTVLG